MSEVRSAIHIRTGQHPAVAAVDQWLSDNGVDVVAHGDVYAACAYLLEYYARVPDLALVGTDWLARDECGIVPYVRQTWPRACIVVYGTNGTVPLADLSPLTRTCDSRAALDALLATTPTNVARQMYAAANVMTHTPLAAPDRPRIVRLAELHPCEHRAASPIADGPVTGRAALDEDPAGARSDLDVGSLAAPRSILTNEELSALLDPTDEA